MTSKLHYELVNLIEESVKSCKLIDEGVLTQELQPVYYTKYPSDDEIILNEKIPDLIIKYKKSDYHLYEFPPDDFNPFSPRSYLIPISIFHKRCVKNFIDYNVHVNALMLRNNPEEVKNVNHLKQFEISFLDFINSSDPKYHSNYIKFWMSIFTQMNELLYRNYDNTFHLNYHSDETIKIICTAISDLQRFVMTFGHSL